MAYVIECWDYVNGGIVRRTVLCRPDELRSPTRPTPKTYANQPGAAYCRIFWRN